MADRPETVEDVLAEMRNMRHIVMEWPDQLSLFATRIESALAREREAVLKVAEEIDRGIQRAGNGDKILRYEQHEVIASLQRWRAALRNAVSK